MKQLIALVAGVLVLFNLGKKEVEQPKSIPLFDKLVSLGEFEPQPEAVAEPQAEVDGNCPDGRCPLPQSRTMQSIPQASSVVVNVPPIVHEAYVSSSVPVVTYQAPIVTYESVPVVVQSAVPTVVYHERRFPNYRFGQPVRNIIRAQPVRTMMRRVFCR